jgi:sporulation integral membrane protein YtvI
VANSIGPEGRRQNSGNPTLILLVFGIIFAVAVSLREAFYPFIIAFLIAYFFDPLLDWMEEKKIPRTAATLIVLTGFFLIMFAAGFMLYPVIERQVLAGIAQLPEYADAGREKVAPLLDKFSSMDSERSRELVASVMEKLGTLPVLILKYIYGFVMSAFSSLGGFVSSFFNMFVIPVAAFYFMRDIDVMKERMRELIPERYREKVDSIYHDINKTLSAFVRGQFTVALVMAFFYSVGLYVIGTPMGIFIGILAGFSGIIPYLSLVTGLIPALVLTWFQFGFEWQMLAVLGLFGAVQLLEGFYLTPKIMGKSVGLHPVAIMLALLVGGFAFGFVGIIIAVPAAAVLKVFWYHFDKYYRSSEYYKSEDRKDRDGE